MLRNVHQSSCGEDLNLSVHSKHVSAFLLDLFFNISWKIKEERRRRKEERREQNLVTSAYASWSHLTMCTPGSTEPGGGAQPVTRKGGGASAKILWVGG